MGLFDKLLRAGEGKKTRALAGLVPDINALEPEIEALSDEGLRAKTNEFRQRIDNAMKGQGDVESGDDIEALEDLDREWEDDLERREAWAAAKEAEERRDKRRIERLDDVLNDLLIDAFAVAREGGRRVLGQRHYDVQLMGGAALHFGWIAEMKTGEGKTLVSTLPVYLNGLAQQGVHVITVNDYLAQRDAAMMGRLHNWLGLSVGIALPGMDAQQKRQMYAADVTYGTNTELGFDYLRDNMARARADMVQRGHRFAIVDEVDSILIDEARTPLIISGPSSESAQLYYQFANVARSLRRDDDYEVDEEKRTVVPTEEGIERVEKALGIDNMYDISAVSYVHQLNQALKAKELYHRDKEYIVADGEVKIVDEFTGRVLEGRRWSEGLHQAVEAKERVKIQEENHTWATVTLQNYFRLYDKLAGMTGTAETEAAEFGNTYGMPVVPIPTNRPMVRNDEPDLIYKGEMGKFNAIVEDVLERNIEGQPVLIGTASVEKSEVLSSLLKKRGVPHEVLNAKQHSREADIVAQAGRIGAVTVATNMAGRGVDILLGGNAEGLAAQEALSQGLAPGTDEYKAVYDEVLPKMQQKTKQEGEQVRALGGLYVLGSERHESRRIDNQLRGRAGRQGDFGESRFYLSLEDDLMRRFATGAMSWVMGRALPEDVPIEAKMVSKAIERAQSTVEARNAEIRKDVLKYDKVMNEQRKVIYARRMQIIDGGDLRDQTLDLLHGAIEAVVEEYTDEAMEEWEPDAMLDAIRQYYATRVTVEEIDALGDADAMIERLTEDATTFYEEKEQSLPGGADQLREIERHLMLEMIDNKWREHLSEMDYLREGINLRGMGQQDPLVAWQREGFAMFGSLMTAIDDDYVKYVTRVEPISSPEDVPLSRQDLSKAQFLAQEEPVQPASAPTPTGQPANAPAPAPAGVVPEAPRIGRNDPCFCGSGKKYKACHGS